MTEQRINERRGLLKSVDALAAQADKQEVYREMDEFQQKAYGADSRRRAQGVRPLAGEGRGARSLRPQPVRPILPAGPPAGGSRRPVHHDQRGRLGHPQRQLRSDAQEAARAGSGHFGAAGGPGAARPAARNRSSPGTASSGAPRESPTRRPGSADGITGPMHFRPSWRAADSRAAKSSAPPTRAAKPSATAPSIRGTSPASIYKLLGIDPHGRLPHPQGCVAYVSPQASRLLTEIM